MSAPQFEHCVTTPACAAMGLAAGADRLELCAALEVGGLSPSPGLMAQVCALPCAVRVLIRPRSGGFSFDAAEIGAMETDIAAARAAGADGVVIGALRDGALDMDVLARLMDAARGMGVTLHRAIDLVDDQPRAVDQAAALGIDCILVSADGPLAQLVARAAGRVQIMAGGGVTPDRIPALRATGVDWLHGSFSAPTAAPLGAPPSPRADAAILTRARAA